MPRICYVILAHSEPRNLLGLVGSLWNSEDAFSIWLDAKADEAVVRVANTLAGLADNIRVRTGRVMSWGGFSIVNTTLMAYSDLRSQFEDFSYAVLCSGTHIPLHHPDRIYDEVRKLGGWIDFCQIAIPQDGLRARDNLPPGWPRDILGRIRYRYDEVPSVGMLPIGEREDWIEPSFSEGSQWHILGRDIIDFIVERQCEIRDHFQNVRVPDEHAFQWAVSRAYCSDLKQGDHVFMNWEGASPRRLSFSEAREIAEKSRFLFARKAPAQCAVNDWFAWANGALKNVQGARQIQAASFELRSTSLQPGASMISRVETLLITILNSLEAALSSALGCLTKLHKLSHRRYVIETGMSYTSAGEIFFLCFAEPSLGIVVVPAVRHMNLRYHDRMRLLPRPPFFSEFVNLTLGSRAGWSIGFTDTMADCREFINAILIYLTAEAP